MKPLSWFGIFRLGLVQTAIGAIFVISTSTLNRVMVVELALPALLPGALIALHYAMQVLRPRLGYGSDVGGRRTPWIVGGMAVLAVGGCLASVATALMTTHLALGIALAVVAFVLIGLGVGGAGTALLVLIAKRTSPARRPAAAAVAWVMMIGGFVLTAVIAGKALDPYSPGRLVVVATSIALGSFFASLLAVWGVEGKTVAETSAQKETPAFGQALREVWQEKTARRFAVFIFVSMLAYGGEELLIEPFAGSTFGMTPGQTAKLSGALHGGALAGMILVALAGTALRKWIFGSLKVWMIGGCLLSALALVSLAAIGLSLFPDVLRIVLFSLGVANGAYAIAAIAAMMQFVGTGEGQKDGVRMGVWGAAQAVAFGLGGIAATLLIDLTRALVTSHTVAYAIVFCCQALVFTMAAVLAGRLQMGAPTNNQSAPAQIGGFVPAHSGGS